MDIEERLRAISPMLSDGRLRDFACKCCRRLLPLFAEPMIDELISFGEARSTGNFEAGSAALLLSKTSHIYDSLYPGHGDPSPVALALSAAGEVAFTDLSLNAAIQSVEFAAQAVAKQIACEANDIDFDHAYNAAYASERIFQHEILSLFL